MSDQLLFDKLAYIDRLSKAGIDETQARAHAEAMQEALRESVATKSDLAGVRTDIERLANATKSDLARVENEIALVRKDLELAVHAMTVRVGAMLAGALSILLAVRFFVR